MNDLTLRILQDAAQPILNKFENRLAAITNKTTDDTDKNYQQNLPDVFKNLKSFIPQFGIAEDYPILIVAQDSEALRAKESILLKLWQSLPMLIANNDYTAVTLYPLLEEAWNQRYNCRSQDKAYYLRALEVWNERDGYVYQEGKPNWTAFNNLRNDVQFCCIMILYLHKSYILKESQKFGAFAQTAARVISFMPAFLHQGNTGIRVIDADISKLQQINIWANLAKKKASVHYLHEESLINPFSFRI